MAEKPGGAYIDDLPEDAEGSGYYELDATVDEYLALHYPGEDALAELLGTAPERRYPQAVRELWSGNPEGRALDVGAATGCVTFDLARDHRLAVGIDLSHALIRGACRVRETGRARYRTVEEGRLTRTWDVAVEIVPARFLVGDALALPFAERSFDTVVALNLLDRVPDPAQVLRELARVAGGELLVGSPFTWLSTFTPMERWLGGFERDGSPVRGPASVQSLLAPAFALVREVKLPFYIRHHARSGQLGLSHILILQRTA